MKKIKMICPNCGNNVISNIYENAFVIICDKCYSRIATSDGNTIKITPFDILTFDSLESAKIYYHSNGKQNKDVTKSDEILSEYEELAAKIGKLVNDRQSTYSDSFGRAGKILEVLYPDGIKPDQYGELLTITRILDKLFRISAGHLDDSYEDICGYALLGAVRNQRNKNGK